EVDVALLVAVAEVPGMEVAAARPRRRRLGVTVVSLEEPGPRRVDDLADGLLGIREAAMLVEARRGARSAGFVEDLHARTTDAERPGGVAVAARAGDCDLARAVAVDDPAAEAACEGVDVLARRFVAVRESQRRVGVVRSFSCRHDVGERTSDVGEQRAAGAAEGGGS